MAIQVCRTVYTFAELAPKAQDKAIDGAARAAAEFWEADAVLDDVEIVLALLGFTVKREGINYSGFCSQGDGASIVGSWYPSDIKPAELRAYAPQDPELHAIADTLGALADRVKSLDAPGVILKRTGHHYVHAYSIGYDYDDMPEAEHETFEHAARDLMNWIYSQLEADYTYQTSDDTIRESLSDDDTPHYREDGRIDS